MPAMKSSLKKKKETSQIIYMEVKQNSLFF